MFKKLDKLILKAFIGPFVATFFITLMVLLMQFFWLYIDDFVGKGLGPNLVLEFILYQSAVLVPLALPLAVLLSSLMTFGNLGESYELVGIRSAGISLIRFMRPLFITSLLICGVAFMFSNNIIPVANLKSRSLLTDIVYAKPSFDLKEGVFYDKISSFAIKVGKKEKDSIIQDIIIYEQRNDLQDNFIIASNGVMRVSANKRFLEFNLRNGWRYEERGNRMTGHTEFIRLGFKEYTKQFDLSSFSLQRTSDSVYRNNARVLSMRQLTVAIDSIRKHNAKIGARTRSDVLMNTHFAGYMDSTWKPAAARADSVKAGPAKIDTASKPDSAAINAAKKLDTARTMDAVIPDSIRALIHQRIGNKLASMTMSNNVVMTQYKEQERNLRLHEIEWHRKLSLSMACLVLFMIGAPLGSIIRKGGLGMPMIISIIFFTLFYFSGTTGEKMAKEGSVAPAVGMWLSTILLLPIGLFITYQAMHDSQLFSKEFYFRLSKKIRAMNGGKKFFNQKRR
ncbi:MAG TPA: LptF/LptG family permease [Flavisolibacter sp.]